MISLASEKPSWKHWRQLPLYLAICLRTLGRYAHSELVFGDRGSKALCFSANYSLGVRYAERDLTDGTWDVIRLTLTLQQEAYIRSVINSMMGDARQPNEKYDMRAIIHDLYPLIRDNINQKDCSGVSAILLARCGYLPIPKDKTAEQTYWTMDPSELEKAVRAKEQL